MKNMKVTFKSKIVFTTHNVMKEFMLILQLIKMSNINTFDTYSNTFYTMPFYNLLDTSDSITTSIVNLTRC